ncbi:MAG TPA: O-antigen ligase family protein [Candidatus Sulfotelmatobacter sp.]|nr:O-antigen ligase family protein [Candidatus Sulfotelmatobacter sp.]
MEQLEATAVDWLAFCLLALEFPLTYVSHYHANSFRSLNNVAVAIFTFFLGRLLLRTPKHMLFVLSILSLGGLHIATLSLYQFAKSVRRLSEVGLADLVALRAQIVAPIHGWPPGEGFTVLLLFLPIACAPAAFLWRFGRGALAGIALLCPTVILAALLLLFSRAIFGATVLFFLSAGVFMIAYRVVSRKAGAILVCSSLGCLLLVLLCESAWYPCIRSAYVGHHTSQVRSREGRLEIWHRSLALVREHPIAGVGASNAGLFLLSSSNAGDTTGFASRAFSLPIQLLVEQGFSGFVLFGVLLIAAALEFHRTMRTGTIDSSELDRRRKRKAKQILIADRRMAAHKAMKCCFAAGIVAGLFRELTYSSLLEHTLTLVMMFALIALACGEVSSV